MLNNWDGRVAKAYHNVILQIINRGHHWECEKTLLNL